MQRNLTLDYFKIILSVLVITIHIPHFSEYLKPIGWYIPNGIARIAVPCFFIINGYYFARKINDKKAIKKYLIHLLIIYTTWFLIYLRPFIYQQELFNIFTEFRIDILLKEFFWGYFHLWYLPALLIGIIMLVLLKKILKKDIFILICGIVLFITGYIIESVVKDQHIARNGFFFGFPFIALGYYIYKYDIQKIKNKYLIAATIISLSFLFFESYEANKIWTTRNIYIALFFLCPSFFLLVLKYSIHKPANNYLNYLGSLSSAIYFSHVYIILKSFTVFSASPLNRFIIVFLISIPVSLLIILINKRIKIFL